MIKFGVAACLFALSAFPALAHQPSHSFLQLTGNAQDTTGHWDIALADLQWLQNLDTDNDGSVTWREIAANNRLVPLLNEAMLLMEQKKPCAIAWRSPLAVEHSDGYYLRFHLRTQCAAENLRIEFRTLFERIPSHQVLLQWHRDASDTPFIITNANPVYKIEMREPAWYGMFAFGIEHILTGFDHMLFLCTLLWPILLIHNTASRRLWTQLLQAVTAFTLAHSVTLFLAVFRLAQPPAALIETAIALSIALSMLAHWKYPQRRTWPLVFLFGLFHGFGFANVLAEMQLELENFAAALLFFNIGIETGQLIWLGAAVAVLTRLKHYTHHIKWQPYFALTIAVIALFWTVERGMAWIVGV